MQNQLAITHFYKPWLVGPMVCVTPGLPLLCGIKVDVLTPEIALFIQFYTVKFLYFRAHRQQMQRMDAMFQDPFGHRSMGGMPSMAITDGREHQRDRQR